MQGKRRICVLAVVCTLMLAAVGRAQEAAATGSANSEGTITSRWNTWSAAAEFVPTTQHYFLGQSEERRFTAVGGEYARRLKRGGAVDVFYVAELRPIVLESDPVFAGYKNPATGSVVLQFPEPQRVVFVEYTPATLLPANIEVVPFYGRTWTYGAAVSPLGTRVNFLPRRRWQPLLEGSAGIHLTTRDVPVAGARSFNFTFAWGTGVEWFLREGQSLRYEFLFRHISNAYSGMTNPGVDLPTIRVVYSFGR